MCIEVHAQHDLEGPAQPGVILKRASIGREREVARRERMLCRRLIRLRIRRRSVVDEPVDDYLCEGGEGGGGKGVARLGAEEVGVDGEGEVGDVGGEEVGERGGGEGAGGWGFAADLE